MSVTARKGLLCALSMLVLSLGLVACGGGDDSSSQATGQTGGDETQSSSSGGGTIAYISLSNNNSYSKNVLEGIETKAQELGASVEAFDGAYSPEKQLAACQQIMNASSKYEAVVMFPFSPAAAKPCGALAATADVPLIAAGIFVGEGLSVESTVNGVIAGVAPPIQENAEAIAGLLVKACEDRDPCKIGRLATVKELPEYEAMMSEQLDTVTSENPNMEIAAEAEAPLEVGADSQVTKNLLQKAPDLDVIFSITVQGPIGAAKAIEQAGKSHDNANGIRLVGDCSNVFVPMLREGEAFGCFPLLPVTEGENATKLAGEASEGKTVESINPLEAAGLPSEFTEENEAEFPDFDGQLTP